MSWVSADEVRRQVERLWNNGDVLRARIGKNSVFPVRLRVRLPSSRQMAAEFGRAQEWIAMLRSLPGIRLEWQGVRSRTLGQQQLPCGLWLDAADDAVAHLGVRAEADRFAALHAETERTLPEVAAWVEANPNRALALASVWGQLLQVVSWKIDSASHVPVYARQADVPGVETKFVERHGVVLAELFDVVQRTDGRLRAPDDFRTRHGFLREPARLRFRLLDSGLGFAGLPGCPDVELDEDSFAVLRLPVRQVFMVENKTNFLAFPAVKGAVVLFGSGYGMRAFGRARWLQEVPMYYWGDIDTHGFSILAQVRAAFPHVASFLMDEGTLLQHEACWIFEGRPASAVSDKLTAAEKAVCERLQPGGCWCGVRLEQERISMATLSACLAALLEDPANDT